MIHIKLSDRRVADPGDLMGRTWFGYDPTLTMEGLFEQNRGRWRLGPRADDETYAVFSHTGDHTIKFVVEITGIERVGTRRALIGHVLPVDHPLSKRYVGEPAPDNHRTPMTYFDDRP